MDRPILFSAPMVRALLEGRKTQTRRILGNLDVFRLPDGSEAPVSCLQVDGEALPRVSIGRVLTGKKLKAAVGDRLWVREAWKPGAWRDDGRIAIDYRASPEMTNTPWCSLPNTIDWPNLHRLWTDELLAGGFRPNSNGFHHWEAGQSPLKWRPSIFMPRWASRITLEVADVRVQRLQDISEADAIAEGIYCSTLGAERDMLDDADGWAEMPDDTPIYFPSDDEDDHLYTSSQMAFHELWDRINDDRGYGSRKNPWVSAYTFHVINRNIDQIGAVT